MFIFLFCAERQPKQKTENSKLKKIQIRFTKKTADEPIFSQM